MGMWTEGFGEAIMEKHLSASDHQSSSVSYEMDGPVCKAMSKTIFCERLKCQCEAEGGRDCADEIMWRFGGRQTPPETAMPVMERMFGKGGGVLFFLCL